MSGAFSVLLSFLPFIFVMWLANFADLRREQGRQEPIFAFVTYTLLGLFYGLLVIMGLVLGLGVDPAAFPIPISSVSTLSLGLWLPSLAALVLILPPVRRLFARFVPAFDPNSTVHAVALSYTMLVIINMMLTLGIGLGNLSNLLATDAVDAQNAAAVQANQNMFLTLWVQQITMAFWGFVGVGWLSRRSWKATLQRLGIERPTWMEVALGAGTGLVLVVGIILLEGAASSIGIGPNPDVESLTDVLLGPLFSSIPGILTMGLAAALGEETIFRGALQPRFGLVLVAFLFALTHSNYGITLSTLLVFVAGLGFGLLRNRYNTTTSMVAHATYNSTLGLFAYLAANFFQNGGI